MNQDLNLLNGVVSSNDGTSIENNEIYENLGNFSARIKSINAFGDLEIEFNETLSVVGFNLSNFNASNTDIKLLPFINQNSNQKINLTNYAFTW